MFQGKGTNEERKVLKMKWYLVEVREDGKRVVIWYGNSKEEAWGAMEIEEALNPENAYLAYSEKDLWKEMF